MLIKTESTGGASVGVEVAVRVGVTVRVDVLVTVRVGVEQAMPKLTCCEVDGR